MGGIKSQEKERRMERWKGSGGGRVKRGKRELNMGRKEREEEK